MSRNKRAIATNLTKLDAHVVQPSEYEDAPELTDAQLAAADVHEGGVLIKRGRGRPKLPVRKVPIKFRLDPDVVERLRASGPGWQTRVNAALRRLVRSKTKLHKKATAKLRRHKKVVAKRHQQRAKARA
jgi:uncharacterized protein (DUF4415 family)